MGSACGQLGEGLDQVKLRGNLSPGVLAGYGQEKWRERHSWKTGGTKSLFVFGMQIESDTKCFC